MEKTRYNQANLLTIIAMWMIVTIHYFNNFGSLITSNTTLLFVSILRGISLIAVPIYIVNIGYTHLHLGKAVNFKKILFYIIIPTVLLTQLNAQLIGAKQVNWTLKEGFSGSWFADMYIGLMLTVPSIQIIYSKEQWRKRLFLTAIPFLCYAFYYSIGRGSTLLQLGNLAFVAYVPLLIVVTFLTFETRFQHTMSLFLGFLLSVAAMSYCYYGIYGVPIIDKSYFLSYFGVFSVISTVCLSKLIYFSNLQLPNIRFVSRSSYFFYFTHYTVINIYKYYFPNLVEAHILRMYIIAIIIAFLLSTVTFYIYDKLLFILKLN